MLPASSIRQNGKEMLSAPARLAISYDNPAQWPAWNMDWEQEQAAPKAYVSGPAQIRVVEDGPARVAIEVTRETQARICPDRQPFCRGWRKTSGIRKCNRLEDSGVESQGNLSSHSSQLDGDV